MCIYTHSYTLITIPGDVVYIYIQYHTHVHTHTHTPSWLFLWRTVTETQDDRPRQSTEAFCRVELPGPRELPGMEVEQTMWKLILPKPFASALKSVSETQSAGRCGDSMKLLRTFSGKAE